ncbi:2', 3'-cyclic nucleotide 2'-phosphodiesterase [Kosmotoga arenicorallina S304]|uniref:2', 3'-cyclic nucleotide 2'-phosphodiesterase n=1 Tax=Kosmotoga arenicorallina S304 TaxID=1453497 RepID=A0A176K002_9BACT|nr:5'-nucleotidase C-terminal domain-containing protein [Kosmotoga arenicorallina]OAA29742.1 2', 3'-cyclic nucleotide 2'-phosphodiesterase [Kosmotoga arenicorallina S304]
MKKLAFVLFVLVISSILLATQFTLTVLHTSDLHGNIFPIDYATNRPSDVGLGKVSTILKNTLAENPATVILDTGDLIQGTPLEYYHAKIDNEPTDPMVLVMNHMGYKASVLGNHEFNYGMGVLEKAISEAEFPFLSANIVKKGTEEPFFKPYHLFNVVSGDNIIVVAYLGLTTKYIPNWEEPKHIEMLDFLDPVEVAKKYVPMLRDVADVVIVGYHGGLERDPETGEPTEDLTGENQGYQLIKEVPGIDVLLTGHQHRTIATVVDGVVVSQPRNWGKVVNRVDITLELKDGKWVITDKAVTSISAGTVDADPDVLALVQDYEDKVQEWLDQPVGIATGDFYVEDPLVARLSDNPLIEFINKVQMEASGAPISSAALFNNSIKGWKAGPVTLRDINAVYIYPNTLKVLKVTGADIKAALERSAEYFSLEDGEVTVTKSWVDPKPRHYNYDMWEGIEYKIAVNKPVGERVIELKFNGVDVDPNAEYEIVLNNYRAGGGGGYSMFAGKPVVREIMLEVSEIIADYILEHETISPTVDGNWTVGVGDVYEIKWNDTLEKIAGNFGITVKELIDMNPFLLDLDRIDAGTQLMIFKPFVPEFAF